MMKIVGQGVNLQLTGQGVKCSLWVRVDIGKNGGESRKSPRPEGKAKNRAKSAFFKVQL